MKHDDQDGVRTGRGRQGDHEHVPSDGAGGGMAPGKRTLTQGLGASDPTSTMLRGLDAAETGLAAVTATHLPAMRAAIEARDMIGARAASAAMTSALAKIDAELAAARRFATLKESDGAASLIAPLEARRDALRAEAAPVLALAPPPAPTLSVAAAFDFATMVDTAPAYDAAEDANRARWGHDLDAAEAPRDNVIDAADRFAVQRRAAGAAKDPSLVQQRAAAGVADTGAALPHLDAIQRSFGAHDVTGVRAHVGGAAADASAAIGAEAYATGNDVAFASSPSLFVAAHEAAHVVQQRAGVSLLGGVGVAGDPYEQHADAVAEAVVRGESAEGLLGEPASARGTPSVQKREEVEGEVSLEDLPADPWGSLTPMYETGAPDEREIDWRDLVGPVQPGDPFDYDPGALEGAAPAAPSGGGQQLVIDQIRRDEQWEAFRTTTLSAQRTHHGLTHSVEAFRHAERDEQLGALGLVLPEAGWQGDVAALTEVQQLPQLGGPSIAGLFDEDNELDLNKRDRKAIRAAAKNTRRGEGEVEASMLGTSEADHELESAVASVESARRLILGEKSTVAASLAAIAAVDASDEADEARAEVEAVKEDIRSVQRGVATVFTFVTAAAHFGAGDAGDGVEQVGLLAAMVAERVGHPDLVRAEQRLQLAQRRLKTEKAKELQHRATTATEHLQSAVATLVAARHTLLAQLASRRQAYNALGAAAGSASGSSEPSQQKLAAVLAAIPLVEIVIARARSVSRSATTPAYSVIAGKGFGMAKYHDDPAYFDFLVGLGEIEYCRNYYSAVELLWAERHEQLFEVKETIGGPRPKTSRS